MLKVKRFALTASKDGYVLRINGDAGEHMDVSATYDQLDWLAEEIDRQLDAEDGSVSV